jgi:hypothetical protein
MRAARAAPAADPPAVHAFLRRRDAYFERQKKKREREKRRNPQVAASQGTDPHGPPVAPRR